MRIIKKNVAVWFELDKKFYKLTILNQRIEKKSWCGLGDFYGVIFFNIPCFISKRKHVKFMLTKFKVKYTFLREILVVIRPCLFHLFKRISDPRIWKRSILPYQIYLFWNACILNHVFQTPCSAHFERIFSNILKCTLKCAFGLSISILKHLFQFQTKFRWFSINFFITHFKFCNKMI